MLWFCGNLINQVLNTVQWCFFYKQKVDLSTNFEGLTKVPPNIAARRAVWAVCFSRYLKMCWEIYFFAYKISYCIPKRWRKSTLGPLANFSTHLLDILTGYVNEGLSDHVTKWSLTKFWLLLHSSDEAVTTLLHLWRLLCSCDDSDEALYSSIVSKREWEK